MYNMKEMKYKTLSSERLYEIALNDIDANIGKIADIICHRDSLDDIKYMYLFTKNIKNAPTKKLVKAICNSDAGREKYAYLLAKENLEQPLSKGMINKLAKATYKKDKFKLCYSDNFYIVDFIKDVKDAPINKLANALCKTNDKEGIIKIAGLNIYNKLNIFTKRKMLNVIIDSNNPKYIYEFAKFVKSKELDTAILMTKDPEYLYAYAKNIKGAPIDRLADRICKFNNPEYIYIFARDIKDAPISLLTKRIIELNNFTCIYHFMNDVKNAQSRKILDEVFKNPNIIEICAVLNNEKNEKLNDMIMQRIYNSNDKRDLLWAVIALKKVNIKRIITELYRLHALNEIKSLIKDISLQRLNVVVDTIIELKDPMFIYNLAEQINNSPELFKRLQDAIMKTNDDDYICKFARLKSANISEMEVQATKNPELKLRLYYIDLNMIEEANKTNSNQEKEIEQPLIKTKKNGLK